MANKKSKEKNILQIAKRTKRNKAVKSTVKTAFKKANAAIEENSSDVSKLVSKAHSEIERAVAKNIIKKKTASRKVSRLYLFMNKSKSMNEQKEAASK